MKNKPFEDVLEEVRSFGRDNSGALIAGSVLAGLALGRFVKSSSPNTRATRTRIALMRPVRGLADLGARTNPSDADQGQDADRGATP